MLQATVLATSSGPNMTQRSDVAIAQSAHVCHMLVKREFGVECDAETLYGQ